ncbi:hypothetical protein AB6813_17455 [bacterium RCC_150]
MTQRSSAHPRGMSRAAIRRPFSAALAGIAMAAAMCAFPMLSAYAEALCQPTLNQENCPPQHVVSPVPSQTPEPVPTQPKVQEPVTPPKAPVAPAPVAPAPVAPAPAVPVQPAPVVVGPAPAAEATIAAEPGDTPSSAPSDTSSASASATPTASSASPSASSNWDTPIQDGLKATQAAAVTGTKGPGTDIFAVVAIMGGVLLVAGGGIAFALWSRNRFSTH